MKKIYKHLTVQGVLMTNEYGEEVLYGLTVSESAFLLFFTDCYDTPDDAAEIRLYFQLRHRHLTACLQRLGGFDIQEQHCISEQRSSALQQLYIQMGHPQNSEK